jgi:hypothetical protein
MNELKGSRGPAGTSSTGKLGMNAYPAKDSSGGVKHVKGDSAGSPKPLVQTVSRTSISGSFRLRSDLGPMRGLRGTDHSG